MAKMKVAVVTKPGGDFEIQEREIPQPGFGEVRIKVHACGVCFSDHLVKDGLWPGHFISACAGARSGRRGG